eukprot:TRINITY_DN7225_c0_g1_i11.p2 TRINITY_DN7225_c0_g1~~TRINITY_DN7225_c0_g1_i11.p2  ORF type:complete len:265 (-),score=50.90 TRINITY_DN7225_c0_g1_i11:160-954(-)
MSNNKALFLAECSVKLQPVICKNVRRGSIILILSARSSAEAVAAEEGLATSGLVLPSFGKLVLQDTCAAYTCTTSGWVANSENSASTTIAEKNCCQATCAAHTCTKGWVANKAKSASITVSEADCCQQTCAAYTCTTSTWVANKANLASTSVTEANCCEALQCPQHRWLDVSDKSCKDCPEGMEVAEDGRHCVEEKAVGLTTLQWTAIGSAFGVLAVVGGGLLTVSGKIQEWCGKGAGPQGGANGHAQAPAQQRRWIDGNQENP